MGYDFRARSGKDRRFHMGAFSWPWLLEAGPGVLFGYRPGIKPGEFISRPDERGRLPTYNDGFHVGAAAGVCSLRTWTETLRILDAAHDSADFAALFMDLREHCATPIAVAQAWRVHRDGGTFQRLAAHDVETARALARRRLNELAPEIARPAVWLAEAIAEMDLAATAPYAPKSDAACAEQARLLAAIQSMKETDGPLHAIRHVAAHVADVPPDHVAAYTDAALVFIPARYPAVKLTRERCAALIDRALAGEALTMDDVAGPT